ncbi:eL32 family ribosomal protein [Candidatus Altiarchaeota archaeon]
MMATEEKPKKGAVKAKKQEKAVKPVAKAKASADKTIAKAQPAKSKPATKVASKPAKPKKADSKDKIIKKPAKPKAKKVKKPKAEEGVQVSSDVPAEGEVPEVEVKPVKVKKEIEISEILYHAKGTIENDPKDTPRFRRQELGKLARLDDKWRSCRGTDSKKAEGKRGRGKSPKIGYKKKKGMTDAVKGFKPVWVDNPGKLTGIDPKTEAVIINANVGRRKRNQIIDQANKQKITILNPRKGEVKVTNKK